MQYTSNLAKTLLAALPDHIDFYGMGRIKGEENQDELIIANMQGISYELIAEHENFKALFVIVFDKERDAFAYSELGNVMAGRLATHLGAFFMISPPKPLSQYALKRIAEMAQGYQATIRRFRHYHGNDKVALQTAFILHPEKGAPHA